MQPFFRLFHYALKYRNRYILGIFVSFLVAVLNGMSLTAFIPLFEALGDRGPNFYMQFGKSERLILRKYLGSTVVVPEVPQPFKMKESLNFLNLTYDPEVRELEKLEYWRLRTLIRWKLRVNAAGYSPFEVAAFACMIALPLYMLKLLLFLVSVRLIAQTGYKIVRDIRDHLYRAVQNLPLTYFYREKTGLMMSRMINDAEIVASVISSNFRDAVTNFFYITTHLGLLAFLNLKLLLISMVLAPLILSPVTFFTRKIRKATTRGQERLADLNAHVLEAIEGVRVIRAFGMEKYEEERFAEANHKYFLRNFKQNFYVRVSPGLVEFFSVIVTLGIIAIGAQLTDQSEFTGGKFIAFLLTLTFILRPVIQLSGMYGKAIQAQVAGTRIFELMDRRSDISDPPHPLSPEPLAIGIEFQNVSFTYPGTTRLVIKNLNLKTTTGTTTALVGESGGGKSTMMDLMARFFDPGGGRILIDGKDIREFRIADHRKRIGIVTQDIFLFHGTIRQNIAYGAKDYSNQLVEECAQMAHAHEFISRLPAAYNTVIGERGITLSGGQKQRIAIARALLRDPEILILDEATSALDTESERLVQLALERLFRNRTTFVIAHRLSTIEKADQIAVLSDGTVNELGTHAELMAIPGGLYARLQDISRQALSGGRST